METITLAHSQMETLPTVFGLQKCPQAAHGTQTGLQLDRAMLAHTQGRAATDLARDRTRRKRALTAVPQRQHVAERIIAEGEAAEQVAHHGSVLGPVHLNRVRATLVQALLDRLDVLWTQFSDFSRPS